MNVRTRGLFSQWTPGGDTYAGISQIMWVWFQTPAIEYPNEVNQMNSLVSSAYKVMLTQNCSLLRVQ